MALAVAAFGIGTTEFVIMGLLPEVAQDLSVSIPRAGLLISAYALGVALGGPLLALFTVRLPRKATLGWMMAIFTAGNLACALSPNYTCLLAARVLTSFCHAAFFGIGSVEAASLVPKEKRAQAMAFMFSGLTIANIIGVPLGTMLGQAAGWRSTFWAVTAIGIAAMAAVAYWLPPSRQEKPAGFRRELRVLRSPQVWLALAISVGASISLFAFFTYIAPYLRTVTGIAPHRVGAVLLLFGVGFTLGNYIGGKLADWKLMPALIGIFVALTAILVLFQVTGTHPLWAVLNMIAWGAASFACCATLQTRVVDKGHEGPNLASTLNIGAFNLGNAAGAWVGGRAIDAGWALTRLPFLGAAFAVVALGLTLFSYRLDRRES